jgi:hypothetical protein
MVKTAHASTSFEAGIQPLSPMNRKGALAENAAISATCPMLHVEYWPIDRLRPYERNPRKNDKAVGRMRASIREFGFAVPVLARSTGEVIDGHLRLKAAIAEKLAQVPVIPCDGWTDAQVKAFRLMVNRSVSWADWDLDALALEFGELKALEFDLSLTGFDSREIDAFTLTPNPAEDEVPLVPDIPVSKPGDLWLCGLHRVLCGSSTNAEDVGLLLGQRKPSLMVTDPPYGISLDSEWRDRAGLNGHGPAEPSYMKHRTAGHTETTISGDTRADWSQAFEVRRECSYTTLARQVIAHKGDLANLVIFVHEAFLWCRAREHAATVRVCPGENNCGRSPHVHACAGRMRPHELFRSMQLFQLRGITKMDRIPEVLQLSVIIDRNRPASPELQHLQKPDFFLGGVTAEGLIVKELPEARIEDGGAFRFPFYKLKPLQAPGSDFAIHGNFHAKGFQIDAPRFDQRLEKQNTILNRGAEYVRLHQGPDHRPRLLVGAFTEPGHQAHPFLAARVPFSNAFGNIEEFLRH